MAEDAKPGILSPWALAREAEELKKRPVHELMKDAARAGKTAVQLRGRAYMFLITLPVTFKGTPEEQTKYTQIGAFGCVGEFLNGVKSPAFEKILKIQSLSYTEDPLMRCPLVLTFGTTKLYAAASSSNVDLAEAMALDRLALAISEAKVTIPTINAFLTKHYITIARRMK